MHDVRDSMLCSTTAAWLRAGHVFGYWGLGAAAFSVAALIWPPNHTTGLGQTLCIAMLLLAPLERILALRVRFDAQLFENFVTMPSLGISIKEDLSALDAALYTLKLRGKASKERSLQERVAGARQLWLWHLAVALTQTLLLLISILTLHPCILRSIC